MTIQDQITAAANSASVPAWFALAIAQRESGFDNNAVGGAGEIGIFQLKPSTAAQLGVDPTDPVQNIAGGVAYLAQLLRTFGGDFQKAAAAFNCGPTCVARAVTAGGAAWVSFIPTSTQSYVSAITGSLPAASPSNLPVAPGITVPGATPTTISEAGFFQPDPATPAWEPWAIGGAVFAGFLLLTAIGRRA
jgi:transglycosylase-like protein with SLT domain